MSIRVAVTRGVSSSISECELTHLDREPIAVDLAIELGVEPHVFAVAVIFAANCSFASPLGYQTNLLVMGPGHYKFTDFARAGLPLIVLLWAAFSLFAPWYYGI